MDRFKLFYGQGRTRSADNTSVKAGTAQSLIIQTGMKFPALSLKILIIGPYISQLLANFKHGSLGMQFIGPDRTEHFEVHFSFAGKLRT